MTVFLFQYLNLCFSFILQAFVGSWFAVFFLAVFYEALKTLRDVLAKREFSRICSPTETHQQTL